MNIRDVIEGKAPLTSDPKHSHAGIQSSAIEYFEGSEPERGGYYVNVSGKANSKAFVNAVKNQLSRAKSQDCQPMERTTQGILVFHVFVGNNSEVDADDIMAKFEARMKSFKKRMESQNYEVIFVPSRTQDTYLESIYL